MNTDNTADHNSIVCAMSIAGSDSGGGAGIQADLLTFAAHGIYGTTAITCLTAQNPEGVSAVHPLPASFVHEQMEQICGYFRVGAAKTGMLFNTEIIDAVVDFARTHKEISLVVDPVMVATSGARLLTEEAIDALKNKLLPLASVITPNLDEAEVLLGRKPQNRDEMRMAGQELAHACKTACLIKGGHLAEITGSIPETVLDILCLPEGIFIEHEHLRIENVNTHGSGCTLSASIAANLALGYSMPDAVAAAIDYLHQTMQNPVKTDRGNFISHLS